MTVTLYTYTRTHHFTCNINAILFTAEDKLKSHKHLHVKTCNVYLSLLFRAGKTLFVLNSGK